MNAALELLSVPVALPASPVAQALTRHGFCFDGEGWARGELHFRRAGRWAVLDQSLGIAAKEHPEVLGQPALWRTVIVDGEAHHVFELPDAILDLSDGDSLFADEEESPFGACLAWALATMEGKAPAGWQPEARADIEALIPKNALTLLAGPTVRQGELIHTPQRLALRFPIVPAVPGNLPASRLAHLRAALLEAQNGWSLVRLGLSSQAAEASVLAEINLTGAPGAALEALISAGLDSLKNVVSRLVETAEVLTDASLASAALDCAEFLKPVKPSTKDQQDDHDH